MSGPHPRVADVRRSVSAALAHPPLPAPLVLVACSGGADSLALAAGAAWSAPRAGLRAGAVVVDHGLQAGSAAVAADAAAACRGLGLDPVRVVRVEVAVDGSGPEAAARSARYAALEAAAVEEGAGAVLLGHTADDQAETVLLGLARGSGARSLAGMAPVRGPWRRPLLGLRRADLREACAALGLQPWDDPHNADPSFARPRVRALLPALQEALGPGAVEALARTAAMLREDADVLDALADDLLERALARARDRALEAELDGSACALAAATAPATDLDVGVLAVAAPAVRRRALLAGAVRAGARAGSLSHRHALALDALVVRWRGQGAVHLPGRVVARRLREIVSLAVDGGLGEERGGRG